MISEQVCHESFVEAGEQLCGPDIGREFFLLRCQNREKFSFCLKGGSVKKAIEFLNAFQ